MSYLKHTTPVQTERDRQVPFSRGRNAKLTRKSLLLSATQKGVSLLGQKYCHSKLESNTIAEWLIIVSIIVSAL